MNLKGALRVAWPIWAAGLAALPLLAGCGPREGPAPPPPPPPRSDSGPPTPSEADAPAPTVELTADPEQVAAGDPSLLSWEAAYASQVTLEPGIGEVDPQGELRVYPEESTTYVATARGPGGTASRSVRVDVGGRPGEGGIEVEDIGAEAPLEERFALNVKPVFFEFDKAELRPEATRVLDENFAWLTLEENRGVRFIIQGHCDERGSDEYNLALGDRRAQAAEDYLLAKGLDPSRVHTVSYGEERPFSTGESEEDHALNRRAHFVLRE